MNKLVTIIFLVISIVNFNFATEFNVIDKINNTDMNFKFKTFNALDDSTNNNVKNYSLTTRGAKSMIELGKMLTFLGIGAFGLSTTAIALGFVTGICALYLSGALTYTGRFLHFLINWSAFLNSLNTSLSVMALSATTICLWVIGGLTLMMVVMIIPGIVLWAVGSSKSSKVISAIDNGIGFSIKI